MNPYAAYQQQQTPAWTRIDMLLELVQGAIDRLVQALAALERNEPDAAGPLLVKAQLLVGELAAGIDLRYGELPQNLLRLYEFVLHNLRLGTPEKLRAAQEVLQTLLESFQAIRPEAVRLERSGGIPPAGSTHTVQVLA